MVNTGFSSMLSIERSVDLGFLSGCSDGPENTSASKFI